MAGNGMNSFKVRKTLFIYYGENDETGRAVDVHEVSHSGYGSTIIGHCRKRDAKRTFRIDQITYCLDPATGRNVPDVLQHLRNLYEGTPEHTLDLLYRNHYEALQILLYVGKADGQLRAEERKVIVAACKVMTGDVRITDDLANALIDAVALPGLQGFKVAVGKVAKRGNPDAMRRLMIACRTIVNTQKTVAAAEQEALDYMAKRFHLD
ncbi:hypothetical protein D9M69_345340 [compost metagenome]